MAITINDVAQLAGVSTGTVSRVINNEPGVKEETRIHVLKICEEHGYRRNLRASSLRGKQTGLIGCILSDLDNPLFAEYALVLEQTAYRLGYQVIVCRGRAEEESIHKLLYYLEGRRVDGIILFSSSRAAGELVRSYKDRVPFILQGCFEGQERDISSVSVDNVTGGRLAAEYLYGLGHREVVYLGVRQSNVSHAMRYQSFMNTAQQLNMSVETIFNEEQASTIGVGYRLGKKLFANSFCATAVFAACDSVAIGVLAAAKEFNISVPDELSVLGFDNIKYSSLPYIRLTTINQPKEGLIEATLRLLMKCINSEQMIAETYHIQPYLVERASCRKL